MQPSWRIQEDGSLSQQIPQDETWQVLRKGGSAGLYIVIVGLSWWLKCLANGNDHNESAHAAAWNIVDDLVWVIRQFNKISKISTPNSPKRARKVTELDDGSQRPKR
jgi:hypothetical protein